MNLHEDKDAFEQYLAATADYIGIANTDIIEKDYYVTFFLKRIAEKQPNVIFKGGTSLSKCHRIINRFSEDIDLNVDTDAAKLTEGQRKRLKKDIISIVEESGFTLENPDQIRSRRDFNRYVINYKATNSFDYLKQYLLVETSVFIKSFPSKVLPAASLVHDFMLSKNTADEIERYGMQPFEVKVQSIERTFIDKVFAIADYYLSSQVESHSRHIYDLNKLYPKITFDSTFSTLVEAVREVRKPHAACLSAQDGVDLKNLLYRIVSEDIYEFDYNRITRTLLFEDVSYSDSIGVLNKIICDGFFDRSVARSGT